MPASCRQAETLRNVENPIARPIRVRNRTKWGQPSEKVPTFPQNERAADSRIVVRTPPASERLISLRGQPPMLGERCTNSTELLRLRESTDGRGRTLRLRQTA